MFCIKCGKEVKKGTKFCTNCGTAVEEAKEAKVEKEKDEKLTYSQNNTIETTSNPNPTPVQPVEEGDGKATASLVLGIVSILLGVGIGFVTSIIGLILGICAKKSGKKTAGIILNAIALALSIIVPLIIISLYGSLLFWIPTTTTYTGTTTPSVTTPTTPSTNSGKVTAGKSFTFGDYEMSIGNNYTIVTDTNINSEHYGDKVIKLPVTIKNNGLSRSHLNMYYHYYYGPSGDKLDKLNSDFTSKDEAIDYVYVDAGETKLQYFYILYDGAGKYKIDLNNHKEQKTVEFTIR